MTIPTSTIVQCQRCLHTWDDDDPFAAPCPCLVLVGQRTIKVITTGKATG